VSGLRSRINRFLGEATAALPASQRNMHIDSHDHLIDIIKKGNVAEAKAEITTHVLGATTRIFTHYAFADGANSNSHD
jgi:DNA-binding GntR family transcriptional regulator